MVMRIGRSALGVMATGMVMLSFGPVSHAQTVTDVPAKNDAASAQQATDRGYTITVQGRRLPAAEAPKWSICSVVARLPLYNIVLRMDPNAMPGVIQPTRMPRNPDYRAPPKVPVGSPLPILGPTRFGLAPGGDMALYGSGPSIVEDTLALSRSRAGDPSALNAVGSLSLDRQAAGTCLLMFGGPLEINQTNITPRGGRGFAAVAAEYAMQDKSLPMAFALFDQGRYAESLPYFRHAAQWLTIINGGDEASLFVGKLLLAGFGKRQETDRAIRYLKRAALANYVERFLLPYFDPAKPELNTASGEAAMMLGDIYRRGLYGIPVDMDEACRWYRRAAFVGHVQAYKVLGDLQYAGIGIPRDRKAAFANYMRAAKRRLPSAQAAVGNMLEEGDEGVAANLPAAIAWYREALKYDDPEAAYALALAYEEGRGVAADKEVAFGLYRTAALKGLSAAQVAIGMYFQTGTWVVHDESAARRWFELAARRGDANGMLGYGALLANGRGGDRDLPRALAWLKRAQSHGSEEAGTAIAVVEARMNAADKAAAAEISEQL